MIEVADLGKAITMVGSADGPTSIFLAGKPDIITAVITVVIGLLICFFGLKIARILAGIVGFVIGAAVGIGVVAAAGIDGIAVPVIILGCAVVLAVLAVVLYRFGIFCMTFLYSLSVGLIVIAGIFSSVYFSTAFIVVMIVVLVASLVLAILSAIFADPLIIIVTSLWGGMSAGTMLIAAAGLGNIAWAGYVAGIVIALIGMGVQFMMQSRKIGKKEKVYAEEVKEKDSVESEVEKARGILNIDDIDEDDTDEDREKEDGADDEDEDDDIAIVELDMNDIDDED